MILILTAPTDVHADEVERRLRARGARVLRFDPARFPQRASLTVRLTGREKQIRLVHDGHTEELTECTSAWWRRPGAPVVHEQVRDVTCREYAQAECLQFTHDIWNALAVPWLPAPVWAIRRADSKHLQLQLAASLGFEIPTTVMTNSGDDFLAFHRQHDGNLIDKMPSVIFSRDPDHLFMRFTQRVTSRDIAYAQRLRYSPMLFQPNVDKQLEVRATVVGKQVLAAEIHSQVTAHTRQDWRRYDHGHTPYREHELPSLVRDRCLALVAQLGLRFGAIDLILTPEGRYVFLEINPNGQWLWVERETGLPITEAVCDLLLAPPADSDTKAA